MPCMRKLKGFFSFMCHVFHVGGKKCIVFGKQKGIHGLLHLGFGAKGDNPYLIVACKETQRWDRLASHLIYLCLS
jgi:hypothetical protein